MNELHTEEQTPITTETSPSPAPKKENFFWDTIKFIIIALIIVAPIRLFIAQPFIVEGSSMEPTFYTGNYLIVDELSYHLRNPSRGEVIILHDPRDPSMFLIKRVIGLPGETVSIVNGTITITSKDDSKGITLNEPYIEYPKYDTLTKTLSSSEYFVMGDNRDKSLDSRILGPIDRSLIVGRAFLRLLPVSKAAVLPGAESQ